MSQAPVEVVIRINSEGLSTEYLDVALYEMENRLMTAFSDAVDGLTAAVQGVSARFANVAELQAALDAERAADVADAAALADAQAKTDSLLAEVTTGTQELTGLTDQLNALGATAPAEAPVDAPVEAPVVDAPAPVDAVVDTPGAVAPVEAPASSDTPLFDDTSSDTGIVVETPVDAAPVDAAPSDVAADAAPVDATPSPRTPDLPGL